MDICPPERNIRQNRENDHERKTIMETRPPDRDDSQDRALVTLTQEEGRRNERTILSSAQRSGKRTPCYSRTCPVTISHPSSREKFVGLAIIDDQAGRTYLDPLVDRTLKLPPEAKKLSTHGTITIEGESRIKTCHLISGLIVTPLDGQKEIALPEVIMQN